MEVQKPNSPSLWSIMAVFLKIGAFTFGGGWAMIPLIRKEVVSQRKWLEDAEFVNLISISQTAPGPIAVNVATVTGRKLRGLPGALCAAFGASFPSYAVILAVAALLVRGRELRWVEAAFKGMRPAIVGLMAAAIWQVGKTSIRSWRDVGTSAIAAVLLLVARANPVWVLLLGATSGVAYGAIVKGHTGETNSDGKVGTGQKRDVSPGDQGYKGPTNDGGGGG